MSPQSSEPGSPASPNAPWPGAPAWSTLPPAARAAWWLLPVCFLLWLYRDGLSAWFIADDFAWLSLLRLVHLRHDLLHEMFAPMAQGTIRPWSERGYFLVLEALFGLDSLPFRIVAFATAAADVLLIAWLTLRATGSRIAGFAAPILWIANSALVRAMTWSSAYNELLCPLFLLSALAFYIRYLETGRRALWWSQVAVFVIGFGALEINVVYPAIAAAWVIFGVQPEPKQRNRRLLGLVPLAGISIAYFVLHRLAAPLPATGAYALHFDSSIFKTLALYWKWTLAPEATRGLGHRHILVVNTFLIASSLALVWFVVRESSSGRLLPLFCLTWFAATLAPVLPLADHRSDYYLTIPAIGIAMLVGAALGQLITASWLYRASVVLAVSVYLWAMLPVTLSDTHWWLLKSLQVRTLVLGVQSARASHPGKAIAVDSVTADQYNFSFADAAFSANGFNDVYLTPESGLNVDPRADPAIRDTVTLAPDVISHAISHNEVVVYSLESDHLRNITEGYARRLSGRLSDRLTVGLAASVRLPTRVDVGNILYSWLLGPTWLPPESGIRWMPGSATLRLGVPENGGSRLELEGYCPEAQLLAASRHLMVLVDGAVVGETRIYDPESNFRRLFPMSGLLAGREFVDLEIRVDPVNRKDGQDYGLVFGKVAVLP